MMKYSLLALICCPLAMFATTTNNLAQYHLGAAPLGMAIGQCKQVVKSPKGDLLSCHRDHKKLLCHFLDNPGAVAQTTILGAVQQKRHIASLVISKMAFYKAFIVRLVCRNMTM